MDRSVAADYRRRGYAVLRHQLSVSLSLKRLIITALASVLVVSVFLTAVYLPVWRSRPGDSTPLICFTAVILTIVTAWVFISTWLRHDRPRREPLSYVETGEIGRISREDGTLEIPDERRETVARVVAQQVPRMVGGSFHQLALTILGTAVFVGGLLMALAGFAYPILSAVIGMQALTSANMLRATVLFLGQYTAAGELAGYGERPLRSEDTEGHPGSVR